MVTLFISAINLNSHKILFKGRLICRFCLEKRPWAGTFLLDPYHPPGEISSSKMILWLWYQLPCPGQISLGQNMFQELFSRTTIKIQHNQYLLHIFRVWLWYILTVFCLILGWRKSIISNLTETSSNKPLPPTSQGRFSEQNRRVFPKPTKFAKKQTVPSITLILFQFWSCLGKRRVKTTCCRPWPMPI